MFPSPLLTALSGLPSALAVSVAVKSEVLRPATLSTVTSGCWEIQAGMLKLHISFCTSGLLAPILQFQKEL